MDVVCAIGDVGLRDQGREQRYRRLDTFYDELAERAKDWTPPTPSFESGCIWKYAQQVGAAREGAVTHPGAAAERSCYADV